ncbi:MAG: 23S rRNA (guanosine(2251)-2'-O)-methyltransferase RlmB, partial [Chitinivibrionales bacterium]|nr:23S rRNA (guanosine(2251)-2'-O)-methyltransferase RlmB [Chitinivibrionales bacterium]
MSSESTRGVVYGIHPVGELLRQRPDEVERVYFLQGRQSPALFDLLKQCRRRRLPYQMVPRQRLDQLSGDGVHQGVAALCAVREYTPFETILAELDSKREPGLLLVPASVSDPHNLGSIVRSCVGFGVDAILLEKGNTAPLTDTVAKSSAGMLEHAAICRPRSLEAAIDELKGRGFRVVGADVGAKKAPEAVPFSGPIVLIVGGEHSGIPPYLAKRCDERVRIPLDPRAESLNVSVACGILLY